MTQATARPPLPRRLRARIDRALHHRRFVRSVRHVSGPSRLEQGARDATVIGLVRDGVYYLDAYLAHYRALGARHFVFCDNGSTDGTLERLAREPDTIVVQSVLPMALIENDFRRLAADRFCAGRWCLYADMDEMFDFDASARIGLPGLLEYLEARGFTAMVAQMLDMVPPGPILAEQARSYGEVIARYAGYETTGTTDRAYDDPALPFAWFLAQNTAPENVGFKFGGLRRRAFGENCCLTKHPLVLNAPGVAPGVHPHCAAGVRVADVTGVLRHYKFTNGFHLRDAASARAGAIPHGEDRLRAARLAETPDPVLWSEHTLRWTGTEALHDAGFLVRSPAWCRHVAPAERRA